MKEPALPNDETERLAALLALRVLDTPAEERFDRITRTASALFLVPIALISLIDRHRQWFKSRTGLDVYETPRAISFCGHAILEDKPLVVEDALADSRFADNPLVSGAPHIRFYAGIPLRAPTGHKLGTLCIIDNKPRRISADEILHLQDLAAWAERELNLATEIEATVIKLRDTFVKLISHELRGPVTSVVGAIDLIRSNLGSDAPLDQLTSIAADGALRLNRLVDNIVGLAELDAKPTTLATQTVDLPDVIAAAIDSYAGHAANSGIKLVANAPEQLEIVTAMRPLVKILRHLLDNAIRFSPAGSTVAVSLANAPEGDMVRISVDDEGAGIPPADVSQMFAPFTQVDAADNRRAEGAGLGLSLAHRLAISIGGRLGYEPRPQGGSRFSLELPRRFPLPDHKEN